MPVTLEKLVAHHARYLAGGVAVIFADERLTWTQFNARVNRLANALQQNGIGKGDKVATADLLGRLDKQRDELELIEAEHFIVVGDGTAAQSYAAFIAAGVETPPAYPELDQEDLFNIVYSSSTCILHPQFNVEAMIDTAHRDNVTHIMMVPAQIIALLQSPNFNTDSMRSLEMLLTIGAPLQQQYKEAVNAVIPGRFYQLYGLTEGFMTILDQTRFNQRPGSVGCPPSGYETRIVDGQGRELPAHEIGEIIGRGRARSGFETQCCRS